MRILVLGGSGMLGHAVARSLQSDFELWTTDRASSGLVSQHTGVPVGRVVQDFDALKPDSLDRALRLSSPDWVINCIGLVKQASEASNQTFLEELNVELPRRIFESTTSISARLIHISTDCVFSGMKGSPYSEIDMPDASDPYGRTKAEGEKHLSGNALIIRTSCVGPEIQRSLGLFEWLMAQPPGTVGGYKHAIWSGVPTLTLGRILKQLVTLDQPLMGTYHLGANPIDKASLLRLMSRNFGGRWQVREIEEPRINRSLNSSKIRLEAGIGLGTWPELVDDLVEHMKLLGRT